MLIATRCENLAEVEVERKHDPVLRNRFFKYLSIREAVQTFITQVYNIMP